jgi:hypothetical protein
VQVGRWFHLRFQVDAIVPKVDVVLVLVYNGFLFSPIQNPMLFLKIGEADV